MFLFRFGWEDKSDILWEQFSQVCLEQLLFIIWKWMGIDFQFILLNSSPKNELIPIPIHHEKNELIPIQKWIEIGRFQERAVRDGATPQQRRLRESPGGEWTP